MSSPTIPPVAPEARAEGPDGSDRALVWEVRLGSEEAAAALFRRYAGRLADLVRASRSAPLGRLIDAEDILQSVFRRFFHRVREGDYAVPSGEDLWSLLLTITLNRLRSAESHHRASKRDLRRERSGEQPPVASTGDRPWEWLIVEETLARLPARYREVATFRLEGYEVTEIAERTGRSLRTVERLLQETRNRLGGLLHDPDR